MRKILIATAILSLAATSYAATTYTTQAQKLGYTVGYDMGHGFKSQDIAVDQTAFQAGFTAGVKGNKPALTKKEMQASIAANRAEMMAKMKAKSAKNGTESQAFMAKIAKEDGVKKLSDGVYYKVLTAGKGKSPSKTDIVTVNYEGKLANGKVFDSSYKRGKPTSFPLNAVIPGWSEALSHMKVGSTWMIYLAPAQAYGEQGRPPVIPENAALTFKVNLISFKPAS